MNSIYGLRIIESPLLPLKWQVKRVSGGYMNRWLIRVEVPVPEYFVSGILGAVYVHPLNMPSLREALIQATLKQARAA